MTHTVIITQSNYIPWRGYFDLIRQADELILLDSVQYTRRDWRNRNRIKTPKGPQWLTIAVNSKGAFTQSIDTTAIAAPDWAENHIRSIEANYRHAPAYGSAGPWLFKLLSRASRLMLQSEVNRLLIEAICRRLDIDVPIRFDREIIPALQLSALDPSTRLARLAEAVDATCYISGPAAKAYLDDRPFAERGIDVEWMDYGGYREYPQCWGKFEPDMSIIDLLLNCGEDAASYFERGVRTKADTPEQ